MKAPSGQHPVAMVTGAAGPIGKAVLERLRVEGFRVAGVDGEVGAGDLPLVVEVTDCAALKAAAARVVAQLGPISVLVTVADAHDAAPIGEMPRGRWQRLLEVHLRGTGNAISAVVPDMLAAARGTVVTTSSWLALAGLPGEAYCAAATGTLLAFTKSFALEVARYGVRVNCVAVGPMATEHAAPSVDVAQMSELTPRHCAMPDEVANTVAFLVNYGDFYVGQVFEPFAGAVV
jgi:NAD(P)-dependent dehydrogenase (short-subunit alcohol dehydrogenase family)